jgi:hypothetical protein
VGKGGAAAHRKRCCVARVCGESISFMQAAFQYIVWFSA